MSDYYPEYSASEGPADLSGHKSETLTYAQAGYATYTNYGFNYWTIMAYSDGQSISVNGSATVPFAYIYVFTKTDETSIPEGTYEFNTSLEPGTAYAGYRDDEYVEIGGSEFYFTDKAYFNQGYLVPAAEWLIASGTLTINKSGWSVSGTARNGSAIRLTGTTGIVNKGKQSAPAKAPKTIQRTIEYCK